MSLVKII